METAYDVSSKSTTPHEKIRKLIRYLEKSSFLGYSRTELFRKSEENPFVSLEQPPFILETMLAKKVILPSKYVHQLGLEQMYIWLSEPIDLPAPEEKIAFGGAFVYLTESHWDDQEKSHGLSSYSALQVITNMALKGDFWSGGGIKEAFEHPLSKLKKMRATIVDERKITSLYNLWC